VTPEDALKSHYDAATAELDERLKSVPLITQRELERRSYEWLDRRLMNVRHLLETTTLRSHEGYAKVLASIEAELDELSLLNIKRSAADSEDALTHTRGIK